MKETIDFPLNEPVTVTLAFAEGRPVQSKFPNSPPRTMRTTAEGRAFFCDLSLELQIMALGPAAGMAVSITKVERPGRRGFDWRVERVDKNAAGLALPSQESAKPAAVGSQTLSKTTDSIQNTTGAADVERRCFGLVDLTSDVMTYALARHGEKLSEKDALSIVLAVESTGGLS